MKKKLEKLRKNIDHIDKKLLELISNRGTLAKEIGLLKGMVLYISLKEKRKSFQSLLRKIKVLCQTIV